MSAHPTLKNSTTYIDDIYGQWWQQQGGGEEPPRVCRSVMTYFSKITSGTHKESGVSLSHILGRCDWSHATNEDGESVVQHSALTPKKRGYVASAQGTPCCQNIPTSMCKPTFLLFFPILYYEWIERERKLNYAVLGEIDYLSNCIFFYFG